MASIGETCEPTFSRTILREVALEVAMSSGKARDSIAIMNGFFARHPPTFRHNFLDLGYLELQ
jgi:hypothetical protein